MYNKICTIQRNSNRRRNKNTDVSGYKVKILSYTPATEATNETEEETAKVKISVNDIPKEIEVGSSAKISDLTVEVVSATEESADVKISGEITSTVGGKVEKLYLKMNGQYVSSLTDDQYREIRLDKTVPFVKAQPDAKVACPEGQTSCKAEDVVIVGGTQIPVLWIVVALTVVILAVVYLLGKTSKKE